MRRATALLVVCGFLAACAGVDKKKFDGVSRAGQALHQEIQSTGVQPRSQSRDLLKKLETEVAAVRDKAIGTGEHDAVQAYAEAVDAYRSFLRFKSLSLDAENNQILLKGPDLEAARRYKLPVDSRDGSRWVNSAQALTILLQASEQHLSDGDRLVNGR